MLSVWRSWLVLTALTLAVASLLPTNGFNDISTQPLMAWRHQPQRRRLSCAWQAWANKVACSAEDSKFNATTTPVAPNHSGDPDNKKAWWQQHQDSIAVKKPKTEYLFLCRKMLELRHGSARVTGGRLALNFDSFVYPHPHHRRRLADALASNISMSETQIHIEKRNNANCSMVEQIKNSSGSRSNIASTTEMVGSTPQLALNSTLSLSKSVILCYSGLLRRFDSNAIPQDHIRMLIGPLRESSLGISELVVAFSLTNGEELPEAVQKLYSADRLSTELITENIDPTILLNDQRRHQNGHQQFFGIEHCGRIIRHAETKRKRAFDFSVRLRYDLHFRDGPLGSFAKLVPTWPVWWESKCGPQANIDVFMFQKHARRDRTENSVRCIPQDVFFVTRARQAPLPRLRSRNSSLLPSVTAEMTSAWLFEGDHRIRGHVSGDNHDHYEATLLGRAFDSEARIATAYTCGGVPCWLLKDDRYIGEGPSPGTVKAAEQAREQSRVKKARQRQHQRQKSPGKAK